MNFQYAALIGFVYLVGFCSAQVTTTAACPACSECTVMSLRPMDAAFFWLAVSLFVVTLIVLGVYLCKYKHGSFQAGDIDFEDGSSSRKRLIMASIDRTI